MKNAEKCVKDIRGMVKRSYAFFSRRGEIPCNIKKMFEEMMSKNFPKLTKGIKLQIQEGPLIPGKIPRKPYLGTS